MPRISRGRGRAFLLLAAVLGLAGGLGRAAEKEVRPAEIEVNGLGWFSNREQRITLERLLGEERGDVLDVNELEDAAFLLNSALIEMGYLKPQIEMVVTTPEGEKRTFMFDATLETLLPRELSAKRVMFNVDEGVRYRFQDVVIEGLTAMPIEDAEEYFLGEQVLITRGARRYTPAQLERAVDGLAGELHRRGYAEARVMLRAVAIDDETGEVEIELQIQEGPRWEVESLQPREGDQVVEIPRLREFIGQAWSHAWQQDVAAAIRNWYYRRGYPDVTVRLTHQAVPRMDGVKAVHVKAEVVPGQQVRIGEVRVEGLKQTREDVLRRRIRRTTGDLLNPLQIDQARFRLSRLGIFDAVDLSYEPADGPVRDPVFRVREGRELEVNLLFGYGSYEQLRGGVEVRQFNLFGRAHQTRLLLVQSMKSTRGEYTYTMPELFGESVDATARVFGLRRQEAAFLRQEYGGNVSLSAPFHRLGVDATVGYTFQALQNRDNKLGTRIADDQQVNAASIEGGLVRDRRDNPLRPRRGYRVFAQVETASRYLGGGVDYQRVEFGGAYHREISRGRWLHVGLNHGFVTTFGSTGDSQLPVNRRFFPGGDNSIRGYQAGEAAPMGPDGRFIGAKSYLLANVEIEQALTTKWSIVVFGDALGTAVRLREYPFDEQLYSVGLGVRYQTLIGPLRAEYGRNVNPRPRDPGGTLLFSIGFPF